LTNIYEALKILGTTFGIEREYTDNWGKTHLTDFETARRILEIKGIKIDPARMNLNPQVMVVCTDKLPDRCSIFIEETTDHGPLAGTVRISEAKGGEFAREYRFPSEEARLDRDDKSDLRFVSVPFPKDLSIGKHELRVDVTVGDERSEAVCHWIVCPARAYSPSSLEAGSRIAGVGIALYGVRSQKNWGAGDFSDLKAIVDWAREDLKVDFIGLNPLHALFNRRPFNSSPYLPSSRLYRNHIYLDIPGIPDFEESEKAQTLVTIFNNRGHFQKLRDEPHVNYEEISALKLQVLREVFRSFLKIHGRKNAETSRWEAFQRYIESEGVFLERFAIFCALDEHFQGKIFRKVESWREWPQAFHDPSSEAVNRFRIENREQTLFWMYIQWQLQQQMSEVQQYAIDKGMIIGLYNDEALAVDRNGADFWAWRSFFSEGFRVGAPPDAFAPSGQDWGFPPPDRDAHRHSGYELFRKMMEANCKNAGALRIDHAIQLHHLFWIPDWGKPKDGVYVKDYEEDLLNLLALVSRENSALIVGEDLGTVPMNLRERLMAKGILSYRLLYFEKDLQGFHRGHAEYPSSALVSISTHDLPTLAGFWASRDIETRNKIGQLDDEQAEAFRVDRQQSKSKLIEKLVQEGFMSEQAGAEALKTELPTEELHEAVLKFLLRSPSLLVMINQEDVFLDERQQNIPGTTWENPNWVTKMRYTLEEFRSDPEAARLSQKFGRLVEEMGR
jgi:4-alpha-glucanotransferase